MKTIDEIRQLRNDAEEKILTILLRLRDETGLCPERLSLETERFHKVTDASATTVIVGVAIELEGI